MDCIQIFQLHLSMLFHASGAEALATDTLPIPVGLFLQVYVVFAISTREVSVYCILHGLVFQLCAIPQVYCSVLSSMIFEGFWEYSAFFFTMLESVRFSFIAINL